MKGNKNSILAVIAIVIGVIGSGLGIYTLFVGGPQGEPGQNGDDAPGSIAVGILGLSEGMTVSGIVSVRAMVAGSDNFTVVVFINGFPVVDYVPYMWDTTGITDIWRNITVVALDLESLETSQDSVNVYISNPPESGNLYYCANAQEIQVAIGDIGAGFGRIVITQDIILDDYIKLNGSGSYILEGMGLVSIVNPSSSGMLWVENATSTIIRDLIIDASAVSPAGYGMYIYELNNNPVVVERVKVFGDSDGNGIQVVSDNVRISNCEFLNLSSGLVLSTAHQCQLIGNLFSNIDFAGISVSNSNETLVANNIIRNVLGNGITFGAVYHSCISNNVISYIENNGIYLNSGNYSTVSGNTISYHYGSESTTKYGIQIYAWANFNTVTGNIVSNLRPSSASGVGLRIEGNENTITGNSFQNNNVNTISDFGTGNVITGNNEG